VITFAWLLEIVLESAGAYMYRRISPLLSALLWFCALTDFIAVPLAIYHPNTIHGWAAWGQTAIKELMLVWLACAICGMFVQERRKSMAVFSAAFLSVGSASIIVAVGSAGETLKQKLLDGEIAANMILLGFVAVGWISRREKLNQAWKWIAVGFMVMIGSDLVFTALWMVWDGARHWYPLGCISAQVIWVCGPLRTVRLSECRADLGQRIVETERVSVC